MSENVRQRKRREEKEREEEDKEFIHLILDVLTLAWSFLKLLMVGSFPKDKRLANREVLGICFYDDSPDEVNVEFMLRTTALLGTNKGGK